MDRGFYEKVMPVTQICDLHHSEDFCPIGTYAYRKIRRTRPHGTVAPATGDHMQPLGFRDFESTKG